MPHQMASETEKLIIVATMMPHVGGVSHVRIANPLRALAGERGISVEIVTGTAFPDLPPGAAGICILHRAILAGEPGLAIIRQLLAKNYVIVADFDDNPDVFPVMRGRDVFAFRGVHAVQTSTAPLADILRLRNPEIAVFPNTIVALPEIANFINPARRTMFFGALNRSLDWGPMLPALNAAAASTGERLHFSIVHDRHLFDALDTPHKTFVPTCDYATYLRLLGQSEISFMPLADTAFNRAKSDLKFIEAAACRVAALASSVVYSGTIEDTRTGLLFRTPEELLQRLVWLAVNPGAMVLGDAARVWVAKHRVLADQTQARLAWYRSLLHRHAELSRDLLGRVPELMETRSEFVAPPELQDSSFDAGTTTGAPNTAALSAIVSLASPELAPLFWRPQRIGVASAWYGHIPFAHWVIGATRPRLLVELGSHAGVSYSAFCDAVRREALPTRCFAVDTWQGDGHAGFYGEDIFTDFRHFHDARYSAFSRMLRCTFNQALPHFADGSVDLLHIDGRHGYEDVLEDFTDWAPKLSPRAVVLFHDTVERERDFGVWRLWKELRQRYPGFEFQHEHGLGLLAVGPDMAPAIATLCGMAEPEPAGTVRERFAALGERWQLLALVQAQRREIENLVVLSHRSQARHEADQVLIHEPRGTA